MKIARIAGMSFPFPPPGYGGTERSMSQMTCFQAMAGNHVTLYGPINSTIIQAAAEIAHKYGYSTELDANDRVFIFKDGVQTGSVTFRTTGFEDTATSGHCSKQRREELLELLLSDAEVVGYDLIHCHEPSLMPRILDAGYKDITICQLHNPDLNEDYSENPYPVIAISEHQAMDIRFRYHANILGVAHHGLDKFNNDASLEHANYLACVGRFSPDKGHHLALQAAQQAKKSLIIGGIAGTAQQKFYYATQIEPHLDIVDETFLTRHANSSASEIAAELEMLSQRLGKPHVTIFVGVVDEPQKQVLYSNALATMFPIRWPEPFGRVMIESMACGTPVIGNEIYNGQLCGAVTEVIDDGLSGIRLSVENDDDAVRKLVRAIETSETMCRAKVREVFEQRWTSEVNAAKLGELYKKFFAEKMHQRVLDQNTGFEHDGYRSPAVA